MRSIERDLPGRPARVTWAGRTPDRPGRSTGETGRADDGWSAYPQPDRAGSRHPITTGATLPRRPAAAAPSPGSGNRRRRPTNADFAAGPRLGRYPQTLQPA